MPAMLHYHRQSVNPDCTIIVFFWCGLIGHWTPVLPLCLATHSAEYLQSLSAPPATDGLVMLPLVLWSRPDQLRPTRPTLALRSRLPTTKPHGFYQRAFAHFLPGFVKVRWRVFSVAKSEELKKWNSVAQSIYVTMCVKGQLSNMFFSKI